MASAGRKARRDPRGAEATQIRYGHGSLIVGGVLLLLGGVACAGHRIEAGVFYSSKGYRVTLPLGRGWEVASDDRADLELRRRASQGGILVNATCGGKAPRRPLAILGRHLTFGIQEKTILESVPLTVAGHQALRVLLEGRLDDAPVRVEAYVVKGEHCVYDLIYVAPPTVFRRGEAEFRAFVGSFAGP